MGELLPSFHYSHYCSFNSENEVKDMSNSGCMIDVLSIVHSQSQEIISFTKGFPEFSEDSGDDIAHDINPPYSQVTNHADSIFFLPPPSVQYVPCFLCSSGAKVSHVLLLLVYVFKSDAVLWKLVSLLHSSATPN